MSLRYLLEFLLQPPFLQQRSRKVVYRFCLMNRFPPFSSHKHSTIPSQYLWQSPLGYKHRPTLPSAKALNASMLVCTNASTYLCLYAPTHRRINASMLVFTNASTHLCLYASTHQRINASTPPYMYASTYQRIYACMHQRGNTAAHEHLYAYRWPCCLSLESPHRKRFASPRCAP
jgi:hypothetical protein